MSDLARILSCNGRACFLLNTHTHTFWEGRRSVVGAGASSNGAQRPMFPRRVAPTRPRRPSKRTGGKAAVQSCASLCQLVCHTSICRVRPCASPSSCRLRNPGTRSDSARWPQLSRCKECIFPPNVGPSASLLCIRRPFLLTWHHSADNDQYVANHFPVTSSGSTADGAAPTSESA